MGISTEVKNKLDLYCEKHDVDYDFVINNGLNYIPDEKYGCSLFGDRFIEKAKRILHCHYDEYLMFKIVKYQDINDCLDALEIYILNSYDKTPQLECRYIWENNIVFKTDFEIIEKTLPSIKWVK